MQNKVLEMLPNGLAVPQIMAVLDEAVEKLLQRASSHLHHPESADLTKRSRKRSLVHTGRIRFFAQYQWILGKALLFRELDVAGPFQLEQEGATYLITQFSVWLGPIPGPAQQLGEAAAALIRIFSDEPANKSGILVRDSLASISQ